jgi:colanic acid biosynthesis glycosyl transferase WcaI
MSDVNIVISESFKEVLVRTRRAPAESIEIIPSWIDGSAIKPTTRHNSWREEMSIPADKFVAMYAGTMGLASAVEVLVEVAAKLKKNGHDDILLICIGDGLLKPEMIRRSAELGLDNIRFLPFQPQGRLSEVQSTADVLLLTMEKSNSGSSVPSKLVTYMAVGRPILCAVQSDSAIARRVALAQCGLLVPPGDAVAISEGLIKMKTDHREWQNRGKSGRAFFQEHMDMPIAMEKFHRLFHRLADRKTAQESAEEPQNFIT